MQAQQGPDRDARSANKANVARLDAWMSGHVPGYRGPVRADLWLTLSVNGCVLRPGLAAEIAPGKVFAIEQRGRLALLHDPSVFEDVAI
jgi:hypothetical protein